MTYFSLVDAENKLLKSLDTDCNIDLNNHLEPVSFKRNEFLNQPDDKLKHVYFPQG